MDQKSQFIDIDDVGAFPFGGFACFRTQFILLCLGYSRQTRSRDQHQPQNQEAKNRPDHVWLLQLESTYRRELGR